MKRILETTRLKSAKSDFLIRLVQHDHGHLYVEIEQTIHSTNQKPETIKINPSILSDIIKVLQNYHESLQGASNLGTKPTSEIDQKKIQERYLKGVTIKDLAMQFDQTSEHIEIILRNRGFEIVENELPKQLLPGKNYKRKRRK